MDLFTLSWNYVFEFCSKGKYLINSSQKFEQLLFFLRKRYNINMHVQICKDRAQKGEILWEGSGLNY